MSSERPADTGLRRESPSAGTALSPNPWEEVRLPPIDREQEQKESASLREEMCLVCEVVIQYRGRALRAPAAISTPRDAVDLARRIARDDAREHFCVLHLDGRHRPIAHSVLSIGTATAALVHPREVFQAGVLLGSVAASFCTITLPVIRLRALRTGNSRSESRTLADCWGSASSTTSYTAGTEPCRRFVRPIPSCSRVNVSHWPHFGPFNQPLVPRSQRETAR